MRIAIVDESSARAAVIEVRTLDSTLAIRSVPCAAGPIALRVARNTG